MYEGLPFQIQIFIKQVLVLFSLVAYSLWKSTYKPKQNPLKLVWKFQKIEICCYLRHYFVKHRGSENLRKLS